MRVVIITKTNRPLGLCAALAIQQSSHKLLTVIAEERFAGKGSKFTFFIKSIKRHGFRFIFNRMVESISHRMGFAQSYLREYSFHSKKIKSLREFSNTTSVPYLVTDDVNSVCCVEQVRKLRPDVIVLSNAPIIKRPLISVANKCVINLHRSLLPQYAGLDAIFWALYHDEAEIGATVHFVEEKIDAGDIILQKKRSVGKYDDVKKLTKWYYEMGPKMIVEALDKIENNDFFPIRQDKAKGSYYSWPTRRQRKELRKKLSKR